MTQFLALMVPTHLMTVLSQTMTTLVPVATGHTQPTPPALSTDQRGRRSHQIRCCQIGCETFLSKGFLPSPDVPLAGHPAFFLGGGPEQRSERRPRTLVGCAVSFVFCLGGRGGGCRLARVFLLAFPVPHHRSSDATDGTWNGPSSSHMMPLAAITAWYFTAWYLLWPEKYNSCCTVGRQIARAVPSMNAQQLSNGAPFACTACARTFKFPAPSHLCVVRSASKCPNLSTMWSYTRIQALEITDEWRPNSPSKSHSLFGKPCAAPPRLKGARAAVL